MWKKTEIEYRQWWLWKQEMQRRLLWHLCWGVAKSVFARSLELGGQFCCAPGRNGYGCCKDVFTFHLLEKKYYKCYTFSIICKDNTAINCITCSAATTKIGLFPSTLTCHTSLVKIVINECKSLFDTALFILWSREWIDIKQGMFNVWK
jgi:hypothetical protein